MKPQMWGSIFAELEVVVSVHQSLGLNLKFREQFLCYSLHWNALIFFFLFRFCLFETSCVQEDNFPSSLCVKVNGKICQINTVCSAYSFFIFLNTRRSPYYENRGRCVGLVVSTLDCWSRGLGSSADRVMVLCSWARHFTLTVSLSTQMGTSKLSGKPDKILGGYLLWTSTIQEE